MDAFDVWRDFFRNWPSGLARRGVMVTSWDDQIPFAGFMCTETMVLLHRSTPDSIGGREVILSYHAVAAVKLTEVVKEKTLAAAGFEGRLEDRSAPKRSPG